MWLQIQIQIKIQIQIQIQIQVGGLNNILLVNLQQMPHIIFLF